jgi:hypothetical protein
MECPNCGIQLSSLTQLLAQTETGTNCPHCWAHIRRLVPPPAPIKALKPPRKSRRARPLRRAA